MYLAKKEKDDPDRVRPQQRGNHERSIGQVKKWSVCWGWQAQTGEHPLSNKTRPVWTGFKIAVRRKLPTHNHKVRCIDILQNSKCKIKQDLNE